MDLKSRLSADRGGPRQNVKREKSSCANDLQIFLDFCGTPQIDAVERVKEIRTNTQPIVHGRA